jgi:pilus assembly protein CpaB
MSATLRLLTVGFLVSVAAGLGLLAFQMSRAAPGPSQTVQENPPPLMTAYIAAAHPLPGGTLAKDEDFISKSAPSHDVPSGAVVDTPEARANLRGSLVRNFLDAGAPITMNDVLRPRDRGFAAAVLREGARAVTVSVDAVSGAAGLIWPGDHVDVLLTQDGQTKGASQNESLLTTQGFSSQTLLTDVRVIAIDQDLAQGAADSAGKLVRTVTLEVDQSQAQKIAVASQMGKLSLAIRSATDQRVEAPVPVTRGDDISPAEGHLVVIYEGNKRREVHVK